MAEEILEGKYRILEVIGEGAFGQVYLANDQYLNRQVAIKELRREDWTEDKYVEFRRRFRREAQIGASLKHENVVDVYTLERKDEDFYLVMEYVDGPSLAERLEREGPMPVQEAIQIAIQLCGGLGVVHGHPLGIVHRDIKPSNVLLTNRGQPKITDFGLAQLAAESGRSRGLGKAHAGTPLYMSPEQEIGTGYLRPASDIYALGCVFFEMLTRKTYKRVEGTKAGQWRREAPKWLDEVLTKMLAVDWRSRHQEALQVKSDLEQGLRGELEREQKLDSLVKQAQRAAGAERWREAIKVCEEGLELEPGHTHLENLLDEAKQGQALEQERRRKERERKRRQRRERIDQLIDAAQGRIRVVAASMANPVGMGIIGISVIACVIGLWWFSGPPRWPPAPPPDSPTPTTSPTGTPSATETPTTVPPPPPTATATATATALPPTATPTHTPAPPTVTPTFTQRPSMRILTDQGTVNSLAFSPDGETLASASHNTAVILWEVASGRQLRTLEGHTGAVDGVAFSPDGATLASGSEDNTVRLWHVHNGALLRILEGHMNSVYDVAFSPDGATLASGSEDNTVILWDAQTGRQLRTLEGHTVGVTSVVFSPDGGAVASGSYDGTVIIWDLQSGRHPRIFEADDTWVRSVDFSPDGGTLAAGLMGGTIMLWDSQTGQRLRALEGHRIGVLSVAFSPDGSRLASGSFDETVILWDAQSGRQLRALAGHPDHVYCVMFSPDGSVLASGSIDGTVILWNVAD